MVIILGLVKTCIPTCLTLLGSPMVSQCGNVETGMGGPSTAQTTCGVHSEKARSTSPPRFSPNPPDSTYNRSPSNHPRHARAGARQSVPDAPRYAVYFHTL